MRSRPRVHCTCESYCTGDFRVAVLGAMEAFDPAAATRDAAVFDPALVEGAHEFLGLLAARPAADAYVRHVGRPEGLFLAGDVAAARRLGRRLGDGGDRIPGACNRECAGTAPVRSKASSIAMPT